MARNLQSPMLKTLVASNTVTATGASTAFSLPLADTYSFILNVTAASGTTPTFDAVYQTSIDGGTTYVNIPWRHTQVTAVTTDWLTVRLGLGVGEAGTESPAAATGGTLVKPSVVDLAHMKLAYTITATTPSFTFALYLLALPPGAAPFA